MRLAVAALLVASVAVPGGQAAAADDATVSFNGAGWGHAVGLSQYGAFGASRDGWDAEQILQHFYQGSNFDVMDGEGDLTEPDDLWVGLDRDLDSVTLIAAEIGYLDPPGPTAPVTVTRSEQTWEMAVNDRLTINYVGARDCELVFSGSFDETSSGSCDLEITWDGDAPKPTRKIEIDDCEFVDWNGDEAGYRTPGLSWPCEYGRGYLVTRAPGPPGSTASGPFDMSLVVDMEDYLLGISEMPYWWGREGDGGMAALKAQVIAARSYARELQLYRGTPGDNSCGAWCHVRDDTYDQRYIGWGHGWSTWIDAVTDTAGVVMTHPDATTSPVASNDTENIVRGYYSSSSGGATENGHEVFGSVSNPKEFYTSVDDHWSLDPSLNFRASWSFDFSADYVASKVGLDTLTSVVVTERNTSGSARTVEFAGTVDGSSETVVLGSSTVRSRLGLYSIYFDVAFGTPAPFVDIAGSVHFDSIVYIAEAGITAGCNPPDNTQFCPDGKVTRGQMAAFLVRALGLVDEGGKDWFSDDDGSTFETDINKLAAAGITFGCNAERTNFCPAGTITRKQMAAFLVRAFGYTDAGEGDWFTDDDGSIFEVDIDKLRVAGVTLGCNPPDNTKFCPDDPVRRDQMASFLTRALGGP